MSETRDREVIERTLRMGSAQAKRFFLGQAALFLFAANHIDPAAADPGKVQRHVVRALRYATKDSSVPVNIEELVDDLFHRYLHEDEAVLERINAYSPEWKMRPGERPQ